MNNLQYDAISKILRRKDDSPTNMAARDVFVNGLEMHQAARKHGIEYTGVRNSCVAVRELIPLLYTAVTGVLPPKDYK